jgi:hypothetical protein
LAFLFYLFFIVYLGKKKLKKKKLNPIKSITQVACLTG